MQSYKQCHERSNKNKLIIMNKILVTGGAGYIGSHTVLELLNKSYDVLVIDNFCNSSKISLNRVSNLSGASIKIIEGDTCSRESLRNIFNEDKIECVIHFAGLKSVAESVKNPNLYYKNNIYGTSCLLDVMNEFNVNKFIFSSSATVYGKESKTPYKEDMKLGTPSSPYGYTKTVIEQLIKDTAFANKSFKAISLRYFNPIGAHPSGEIGEDPHGTPNNLLPFISQVAIGKMKELNIYGNDYETPDGTCRRDYLHVMDLANGHLAALEHLNQKKSVNYEIFNLGTGKPLSVLEVIKKFEEVAGIKIPYRFCNRRDGDLPEFWADSSKANLILGWSCKKGLSEMIEDTWNWQSKNPNGY